jgi:hypothetical protein
MLSRLTLYTRIPELFTANLMPSLPFSREMRRRQLLFCSDLSDFWRATLQQDGRRLTAGDLFLYTYIDAGTKSGTIGRSIGSPQGSFVARCISGVFLQLFVLPQERERNAFEARNEFDNYCTWGRPLPFLATAAASLSSLRILLRKSFSQLMLFIMGNFSVRRERRNR